ncbi:MAG: thiamine phosphate synthase [Armatimonadetes bacterium]|nr:thiamine phosphate synthase [Armatimonadota bacterium]
MDLSVYVITDRRVGGRSHEEVAEGAVEGGATALQFREKAMTTRQLIEAAGRLRAIARRRGVLFIVNDRVDVALAVDADGVHVGEDDMPVALARRLMGPEKIVGVSASSPEEALAAVRDGASYLGVGSVYATATKPEAGAPIGSARLAAVRRAVSVPVVAIGGITIENAAEAIRAGADGVAVISAVAGAPDPVAAARRLREVVDAARRR